MISYGVAALWILRPFLQGRAAIRLHWPARGFHWAAFADILKVGATSCVVVLLMNAAVLVVTGLIGRAGDAAIAGYGIGSRLEYLLSPLTFGVGAALIAMVGTNKGAQPVRPRPQRIAWSGALMAGAVTGRDRRRRGDVARPVARPLHPRPGGARRGPASISASSGPTYGFFGLAMALNFASQGAGDDGVADRRQPRPHRRRRRRRPAGARRAGLGRAGHLWLRRRLGILIYSLLLAFSTTRPAWRR